MKSNLIIDDFFEWVSKDIKFEFSVIAVHDIAAVFIMWFPVCTVNYINVFQPSIDDVILLRNNLHETIDIEFKTINASDAYLNDVKYDLNTVDTV